MRAGCESTLLWHLTRVLQMTGAKLEKPANPTQPPTVQLNMHDPRPFQIVSPFKPMGDQPTAIESLVSRLQGGARGACLLGATGTGKTFTVANVIERLQRPTLILSHNKTLAAQLYEEMKELFPHNAVSYFVSYYDYYQPEAYIPARDIYIEKDSSRNDDLDKLRLAATSNLLSRKDTIVVASVSCIFGLGSPEAYGQKVLTIERGTRIDRRAFLLALVAMQYKRAEMEFIRSTYRVRGDVVEIYPAYEQFAVRVELFGDEIEHIRLVNPTSGEELAEESRFFLFPAAHYVVGENGLEAAVSAIRGELEARVNQLRGEGKVLEAQRLMARTKYDLEMLAEVGICNGIENYSRHLDGRQPGERPWTLIDYFEFVPGGPRVKRELAKPGTPVDWLLVIDESHVTIPQVHAMFNGDQARKKVLVEHGFRLPSAMDNRPLRFSEFETIVPQTLYVSATPARYELERCEGEVSEQVIRPTGLLDPTIEIKPARGQVPDLIERCLDRVASRERVIVTALTKRLCEDLTLYLHEKGLRVRYLHSEIETLERLEILTALRSGDFDVLVGVNLLREGLDLPEVSLVAILDADKEGFLRSTTSLIQQIGRAARNVNAHVVMYADTMTPSMRAAIDETERRRKKQMAFNTANGITPQTIIKAIRRGMEMELRAGRTAREAVKAKEPEFEQTELLRQLEDEMLSAATDLQFEKAAKLRDQVAAIKAGKVKSLAMSGKMRRSDVERNGDPSSIERKAGMPGVRASKKRKSKRPE